MPRKLHPLWFLTYNCMRKKSWWPAWFPYPISWLRAIILCVTAGFPLSFSFRIFGLTGFSVTARTGHPGPAALMSLVSLILPFVFLSYVHHFTVNRGRREPGWPSKLPSPKSIWEGFFALTVFLLSSLILLVVIALNVSRYYYDVSEEELGFLVIVYFLTMVYFYQAEYLIRNFSPITTDKTSSTQTPASKLAVKQPEYSVDDELEKLRREMNGQ